eukprot:6208681-Pleurochrysis_carterae.AAC.3
MSAATAAEVDASTDGTATALASKPAKSTISTARVVDAETMSVGESALSTSSCPFDGDTGMLYWRTRGEQHEKAESTFDNVSEVAGNAGKSQEEELFVRDKDCSVTKAVEKAASLERVAGLSISPDGQLAREETPSRASESGTHLTVPTSAQTCSACGKSFASRNKWARA